ncbi:MAG: VCBS repeat-containing protein, partial [Aridibacter famidurans]|nr:VCBS repeat-containing protein [Aridibacter famidurans]
TNTLFEANQGGSLGGAGVICCGNGTPETPIIMENVAFIRNVTGNNGSAVRLSSGPNKLFEFKNVTVAHNTSVIGAAMILQFGQFSFENSTIAYNKSTEPSDFRTIGILSQWGDSVLSFRNTIVAKNSNVNGVDMDLDVQDRVFGSLNSLGYNIFGSLVGTTAVEGDTTGNQIGVDPGLYFVPQGAGSPLMTMALVPGSPAIDAGDPGNFLATDPRGVARPVDGDGNGSALPDIGAFERTPVGLIPLKPVFDFDGDARTDLSIFRPGADPAQWWFLRSSDQGTRGLQFGSASDVPVAADFTGDGRTDIAFWRPSTGEWFILRSEDDSFFAFPFGAAGDIPAPGDFDGDGKADPAIYRPSAGTWFIYRSSNGAVSAVPFGVATDKPIVADYDGDGLDDIGVYRSPDNQFWLLRSSLGVKAYQFGAPGDRTAIGDWTGDGKADVAFFRPSTSEWYVIRSEDDSFFAFPWGATGDVPSPGDFDGDGQTDPAVWRPSDRTWYIFGSTNGFEAVLFGATGDVPLPSSVSVN